MKAESGKRKATNYEITPLGAAIVEALPDRRRVAKINRDYRRSGKVPPSVLFPEGIPSVFARKSEG